MKPRVEYEQRTKKKSKRENASNRRNGRKRGKKEDWMGVKQRKEVERMSDQLISLDENCFLILSLFFIHPSSWNCGRKNNFFLTDFLLFWLLALINLLVNYEFIQKTIRGMNNENIYSVEKIWKLIRKWSDTERKGKVKYSWIIPSLHCCQQTARKELGPFAWEWIGRLWFMIFHHDWRSYFQPLIESDSKFQPVWKERMK